MIHNEDLSSEAFSSLIGELALGVDFETGCPNKLHSIPCNDKCALKAEVGNLQQVQLCDSRGNTHIIRMQQPITLYKSRNLIKLLKSVPVKVSHFAKFEAEWSREHLSILDEGIHLCTRIGNSMYHEYTNISAPVHFGNTVNEHLGHQVDKEDKIYLYGWDQPKLTKRQIEYSVNDVIYLLPLASALKANLSNIPGYSNAVDTWIKACKLQSQIINLEDSGVEFKWLMRYN